MSGAVERASEERGSGGVRRRRSEGHAGRSGGGGGERERTERVLARRRRRRGGRGGGEEEEEEEEENTQKREGRGSRGQEQSDQEKRPGSRRSGSGGGGGGARTNTAPVAETTAAAVQNKRRRRGAAPAAAVGSGVRSSHAEGPAGTSRARMGNEATHSHMAPQEEDEREGAEHEEGGNEYRRRRVGEGSDGREAASNDDDDVMDATADEGMTHERDETARRRTRLPQGASNANAHASGDKATGAYRAQDKDTDTTVTTTNNDATNGNTKSNSSSDKDVTALIDAIAAMEGLPRVEEQRLRAERTGPHGLIRSDQLVRSMEQELIALGFPDVASLLEKRSGVRLCTDPAKRFSDAVLRGAYADAIEHLAHLETRDADRVRQMLLEAKVYEETERGNIDEALRTIREQLTPAGTASKEELEQLCLRVVFAAAAAKRKSVTGNGNGKVGSSVKNKSTKENGNGHRPRAGGQTNTQEENDDDGDDENDVEELVDEDEEEYDVHALKLHEERKALLERVSHYVPAHVLIPARRLTSLVEHALVTQRQQSVFFNARRSKREIDLFEDFSCGKEQLPTRSTCVLDAHTHEVWHVQFSRSGKMLATASRDKTAIIWDITTTSNASAASDLRNGNCTTTTTTATTTSSSTAGIGFTVRHTLSGHSDALTHVAWSPDDSYLLTASNDKRLCLWSVETGTRIRQFTKHIQAVNTCAWLPDGKRFVSGGQDKSLYLQDVETGAILRAWHGSHINDLAVSPNGRLLAAVCNGKKVHIHSLVDERDNLAHISESEAITSMSFSRDGRCILVNLMSQKVHMWMLSYTDARGAGKSTTGTGVGVFKEEVPRWVGIARSTINQSINQSINRIFNDVHDVRGGHASSSPGTAATGTAGAPMRAGNTEARGNTRLDTYPPFDPLEPDYSVWQVRSGEPAYVPSPPSYITNELNLGRELRHIPSVGTGPAVKYHGLPEDSGRYVIHSCFGGSQGNFVASGSEDSQVYIWHRDSGELLAVLPGHSGTVNAVHWNPVDHHILASASDDGTVRVWVSEELYKESTDYQSARMRRERNGMLQPEGKEKVG